MITKKKGLHGAIHLSRSPRPLSTPLLLLLPFCSGTRAHPLGLLLTA